LLKHCWLLVALLALAPGMLLAKVTGSISGTVRDAQGAVIPGVAVTARNTQTGVVQTIQTDSVGFYNFPALAIGNYDLSFQRTGFQVYQEKDLVINVDTALRVDAVLEVGTVTQEVTVTAAAAQIDTRTTQMGEVIADTKMVSLPLNGRSYTDLLALQPGVTPISAGEYSGAMQPSGNLNAGTLSISGMRENMNGYMVNGATVEEGIWDAAAVIPDLDSIAEFRILTNNFDAEYGNYSGGQVNVATKSGTNQFHGDLFEFLRNSDLDSRNFFSPARGVFHQNQFGGTLGGPIRRNKIFFFADYQGTRQVIGIASGDIPVPSAADRTGNLADEAAALTGTVEGQAWGNMLASELGYPVSAGEAYYTPGCTSSADCVFPNAVIPQSAWSSPAAPLMEYIPLPNVPGGYFSTSAYPSTLQDDKGSMRVDGNSRWGQLSAYYLDDKYTSVNPYAGGNLPGFSATTIGKAQLLVLSATTSFGSSTVNQFSFSYLRDANDLGTPIGGIGPTLASLGFASPADLGPYPDVPKLQGVPSIVLNNYSFGINGYPLNQFNNTFQWQDNFSKVLAAHTLKFGADYHYDQVNVRMPFAVSNGWFDLNGTETGLDFADYLVGAVSAYNQGVPAALDLRGWYAGLYAQDSWRAAHNLTLSAGVRWEATPFWADTQNRNPDFIPGEESQIFPTAPLGYVFPGDKGVPHTFAPTRYGNFGPRVGLAYSPSASQGILHRLLGGSGKTSIRAGFGIYYTAIEGYATSNTIAAPPYGIYYVAPASPLFAQPFITRSSGVSLGQRFPLPPPPPGVSVSHPDSSVNWAQFEPISSDAALQSDDQNPYGESYMFSLQRQLGANTMLSMSYVGTQGHHLVDDLDMNPGNPALCLGVSQQSEVLPGTPTCGPFGENGIYYPVTGGVLNGTRTPFGNAFGGNGYYATMGNSKYNSLEVTLRHTSPRAEFLAGYTYSKALDNSSGYGEQVLPFNYRLSEALGASDMTHNFTFSYAHELPFDKLFRRSNRLTRGWRLSGITRFATGLPVTLFEYDDDSLLGSCSTGPNGNCSDLPDFTPGKILNDTNPRHGNAYFNTSLFSGEPLGQQGTAGRRFFHGPGINNWDMALLKDVHLTESKTLELRGEFFNIFNHAQFYGPTAVDANFNAGPGVFGQVLSAAAPRIGQVAVKFYF
jgi:hypothetical protein